MEGRSPFRFRIYLLHPTKLCRVQTSKGWQICYNQALHIFGTVRHFFFLSSPSSPSPWFWVRGNFFLLAWLRERGKGTTTTKGEGKEEEERRKSDRLRLREQRRKWKERRKGAFRAGRKEVEREREGGSRKQQKRGSAVDCLDTGKKRRKREEGGKPGLIKGGGRKGENRLENRLLSCWQTCCEAYLLTEKNETLL